MEEANLRSGLAQLGIQEDCWRAVLVLPLVQVAWADGEIQAGERRRIQAVAAHLGCQGPLVDGWLTTCPSPKDQKSARMLIVELAHRERGLGAELETEVLADLQALCMEVAAAAGGLFGVVFSVSAEERAAIGSIAADLQERSRGFLEQLPSPESGSFQDL